MHEYPVLFQRGIGKQPLLYRSSTFILVTYLYFIRLNKKIRQFRISLGTSRHALSSCTTANTHFLPFISFLSYSFHIVQISECCLQPYPAHTALTIYLAHFPTSPFPLTPNFSSPTFFTHALPSQPYRRLFTHSHTFGHRVLVRRIPFFYSFIPVFTLFDDPSETRALVLRFHIFIFSDVSSISRTSRSSILRLQTSRSLKIYPKFAFSVLYQSSTHPASSLACFEDPFRSPTILCHRSISIPLLPTSRSSKIHPEVRALQYFATELGCLPPPSLATPNRRRIKTKVGIASKITQSRPPQKPPAS
ncbi:hypothetical protein B0I35DRAFT_27592 [Stachybotrys elegans]|uniref:Uncharacterized protein n=1 Tax=Stachybotrys elegans TaxID=80388 RepID=A0A8K0WYE7_9HYPO|nr:hypothetical protein B0I35DRAFT_27592 [Stachybotrys elegans]